MHNHVCTRDLQRPVIIISALHEGREANKRIGRYHKIKERKVLVHCQQSTTGGLPLRTLGLDMPAGGLRQDMLYYLLVSQTLSLQTARGSMM
jgi:hypothetical protein